MVKYRVIERKSPEGNWAPFGVAYERENHVLLFVPAWRGQRALDDAPLVSNLDRQHFPSQSFPYRWSEVYDWMEDETFRPIAALREYPPVQKPIPREYPSVQRPIQVAALWKQLIERRKYRFVTTIQVQFVKSGLELIAQGRKLEEALPIDYKKKPVAVMGRDYNHELRIPLPEIGEVNITIRRRVEPGAINLTIQTPAEVKVKLSSEDYKDLSETDINEVTRDYTGLYAGKYKISIVWGARNQTWEIPLEVK